MVVVVHGKGTVLVKLHQVDGVDRLYLGSVRDQWYLAVVVCRYFGGGGLCWVKTEVVVDFVVDGMKERRARGDREKKRMKEEKKTIS